MFRRICLMLAFMFLVTACGGGSNGEGAGSGSKEADQGEVPVLVDEAEEKPSLSDEEVISEVSDTNESFGSCRPTDWEITPSVYQFPQGDGWKLMVVGLLVVNNTGCWSDLSIEPFNGLSKLVSSDGAVYEASRDRIRVPEQPQSPFSGRTRGNIGAGVDTGFIPPGVGISGIVSGGNPPESDYFSIFFMVGEQQTGFTLFLDGVNIRYFTQETEERFRADTIALLLGDQYAAPHFPTSGNNFPPLSAPVTIDVGVVEFLGVEKIKANHQVFDEVVSITFTFENTSTAYGAEGHMYGSIVGNDGLLRPLCGAGICNSAAEGYTYGRFDAGPGQSGNGEMRFLGSQGVGDYIFVWYDPYTRFHTVLNLPD